MEASATPLRPDLVIALVKPIGVEIDPLMDGLKYLFGGVGYDTETVRISEMLEIPEIKSLWDDGGAPKSEKDKKLALMEAGTKVRKKLKTPDALAMFAVQEAARLFLRRQLERLQQPKVSTHRGTIVIISSLKHPDEIKLLRRVYGSACFVLGAYDSEEHRRANLARELATKSGAIKSDANDADAGELIKQDFDQQGEPLGQHLSETFARCDYFLDAGDIHNLHSQVSRFVELIFGHPFHTPTRDELFMATAHLASLRSASMARAG